jgi:hypothetical protein
MNRFKRLAAALIYMQDAELVGSPNRPDMDRFVIQAVCATMYSILTTGVFLSGYLIYLGAPEWLVSYATMIPTIALIAIPLSAGWVEKKERRLRLTVAFDICQRVAFVLILAAPFLLEKKFAVPVCCFLLTLSYSLNGIYGTVLNNIFLQVIPLKIRGRYLSARYIMLTLVNAVFPIIAGQVVDRFAGGYTGFLIIYSVAAAAGAVECYVNTRLTNPVFKAIKSKLKIRDIFAIPARDKAFMAYVIPNILFYLFLYIGASFSNVFMLTYLNLSYTYINTLAMVSAVLQILVFYRFWGKVNDRVSPNCVMLLSMCLYVPEMLLWAFMTNKSVYFVLPICYCISSLNASGFAIGNFNRRYELTPDEGWVLYDSFANALIALMFLISPFIANLLRKAALGWGVAGSWENGHIRVVYMASAFLLLLLQAYCYLSLKRKSPEDAALKKESYKLAAVMLWKSVFGRK